MSNETKNEQSMSAELSQKVTHIQDSVTDLSGQFTEMQTQFREMYTAIVGDKKFGHSGLVQRVEILESTKKKWENKVSWLYGYVIGAGTLITVIYELIKNSLIK
jgi:hypothetical protein